MTAKQKRMLKNRLRVFCTELSTLQFATVSAEKALAVVNSNTNLTNEIGITLIRDFPKFEYLGPQADWFKATIRKVCSGELNPREASRMMAASYQEMMELSECFNKLALYSETKHVPMEPLSED